MIPALLVVDDDDQFRSMLRELLDRAGHHVAVAASGQDAIAHCARTPVALVITDILMPDEDGIRAITALRHAHPKLRIIATSGAVHAEGMPVLARALRAGADRTLAKPFSTRLLLDTVRDLLALG